MGKYLEVKLNELKSHHVSIGDVRGIGLFRAIEIVKDKETKKPFNTKEDKINGVPLLVDKISGELMKKGIYVSSWISHFVLAPPLIITKEEIDAAINALDEVLKIADDEVGK